MNIANPFRLDVASQPDNLLDIMVLILLLGTSGDRYIHTPINVVVVKDSAALDVIRYAWSEICKEERKNWSSVNLLGFIVVELIEDEDEEDDDAPRNLPILLGSSAIPFGTPYIGLCTVLNLLPITTPA